MEKFSFSYGCEKWQTVTVQAIDLKRAYVKARETLDMRYEKQGKEAPVAWTLRIIKK